MELKNISRLRNCKDTLLSITPQAPADHKGGTFETRRRQEKLGKTPMGWQTGSVLETNVAWCFQIANYKLLSRETPRIPIQPRTGRNDLTHITQILPV